MVIILNMIAYFMLVSSDAGKVTRKIVLIVKNHYLKSRMN